MPRVSDDLIFCFVGEPKSGLLINMNQIKLVDEIRSGHCRIWFAKDHTIDIGGPGADQLLAYFMARATAADGTPVSEYMKAPMSDTTP